MSTIANANYPLSIKTLMCLNRKFLVYNLILRNLKLRYRKSYIGILWTILIPAANAFVYNMVFNYIMRVDIPNYLLFLLSGLLPWTFFSTAITHGTESLITNQQVLNKVPIPPFAFILADNLTNLLNLVLAFPVLLIVALWTGISWNPIQLALPIVLSLLFLQAFGLSIILGYSYVYFRDLRHIIAIFLQIWFYLTPVIYNVKMIPEKMKYIIWLNPVAIIFQYMHAVFTTSEVIDSSQLLIPLVWTSLILVAALIVVRKFNRNIVESL